MVGWWAELYKIREVTIPKASGVWERQMSLMQRPGGNAERKENDQVCELDNVENSHAGCISLL